MEKRLNGTRGGKYLSARWLTLLWQLIRPYGRFVYYALWPARRPDYFQAPWRYPVSKLSRQLLRDISILPEDREHSVFLFLPMVDWHVRFQRSQQLARALAGLGHTCIYVNPQLGFEYRAPYVFDPLPRVGVLAGGIFELHVHLPREHEAHTRALRPSEVSRVVQAVEALLAAGDFSSVTQIVSFPRWLEVAESLRSAFGFPIVYDCHDFLPGFERISQEVLEREEALLERSDFVVFSSEYLQEVTTRRLPSIQPKSGLVRNGANPTDFTSALSFTRPAGRRIIGYAGALDWWFDVDLLMHAAAAHPDCLFQLVGRVEHAGVLRMKSCPNVELVGEVPYGRIPGYLKTWDAAMVPFLINTVTDAVDAIKLYEYFSAGLPVISTPLPEAKRFSGIVYIAEDAASFSACIGAALAEEGEAKRESRLAVARAETWASRAESLLELVSQPRPAPAPATLPA